MQAATATLDSTAPAEMTGGAEDRIANRVPLECQVAMRFENFDDFVTECSMNISATGMFVRCSDPQPAGSVLDFKFALADGEKLIRGYGEVVWARHRDDGSERPAGMGIRFLHLDAESRELIHWTVTRRYITGAGPCDVDAIKSAMQRAAEPEAIAEPDRPARPLDPRHIPAPARGDSPPPRYLEAGYAAVATAPRAHAKQLVPAIAIVVMGGFYLLQTDWTSADASPAAVEIVATGRASERAVPETLVSEAADDVALPDAETRLVPLTEPTIVDEPAALQQAASQVIPPPEEVVKNWARAWSRQEVDAYLAFYASDFKPTGGLSRDAWEKQRDQRITKPRWIQIELGPFITELEGDSAARVTFDQSYRSNSYRDVVRKTLVMVREADGWRVLEEFAAS